MPARPRARASALLLPILLFTALISALSVISNQTTILGIDPQGSARLNGESFQQSPLTTFANYQYAAFYISTGIYAVNHISLARRQLNGVSASNWDIITFTDYNQTTLDEHNTISLGISPGDASIHISFDHHDVPLNYRHTSPGAANGSAWSTSLFSPVLHSLPGASDGPYTPLTYPRFEPNPSHGELLFEFRIGQSGNGSSYIYTYNPSLHSWTQTSEYLRGSNNNAYINSLDYLDNKIHATWTWRETPDVVTNHDLCYIFSSDGGKSWRNSAGVDIGTFATPDTAGVTVFNIPQNSGILNQEGQTVDQEGRVHVLNRENRGTGEYRWWHYWRSIEGNWTRDAIIVEGLGQATATGFRGKLAAVKGKLIAVIPEQVSGEIKVLISTAEGDFKDWREVWRGERFAVDPGVDKQRLRMGGDGKWVLSLFARQDGGYPQRKVVVVDLVLAD
jgi:hypothetical protein